MTSLSPVIPDWTGLPSALQSGGALPPGTAGIGLDFAGLLDAAKALPPGAGGAEGELSLGTLPLPGMAAARVRLPEGTTPGATLNGEASGAETIPAPRAEPATLTPPATTLAGWPGGKILPEAGALLPPALPPSVPPTLSPVAPDAAPPAGAATPTSLIEVAAPLPAPVAPTATAAVPAALPAALPRTSERTEQPPVAPFARPPVTVPATQSLADATSLPSPATVVSGEAAPASLVDRSARGAPTRIAFSAEEPLAQTAETDVAPFDLSPRDGGDDTPDESTAPLAGTTETPPLAMTPALPPVPASDAAPVPAPAPPPVLTAAPTIDPTAAASLPVNLAVATAPSPDAAAAGTPVSTSAFAAAAYPQAVRAAAARFLSGASPTAIAPSPTASAPAQADADRPSAGAGASAGAGTAQASPALTLPAQPATASDPAALALLGSDSVEPAPDDAPAVPTAAAANAAPPATAPAASSAAVIAAAVPQPMPATDAPVEARAPAAPGTQIESTIAQVGDIREALRSARPAMTIQHAEFGAVSIRLEPAAPDQWRAVLASRDPGFVPAIQAALETRAIAAADTSSNLAGQSGSHQHGASQNGAGDQRYGASPNSGQGGSQPYLGQSGSRDGEAAPDHRRPSTAATLAARGQGEPEDPASRAAGSGGLFA